MMDRNIELTAEITLITSFQDADLMREGYQ
ncbi:MAG: hypothetical protein ACJAT7_000522 [Psychromonas sp.]|jgi:hypothetical protein